MATPIKDTPTISGKESRRFNKLLADQKKVSKEEIQRIKDSLVIRSDKDVIESRNSAYKLLVP